MHDHVEWKTAPPLWPNALSGDVELDQPAVLRFATDDFMERLQSELDQPDRSIAPYVARAETWRAPAAGIGQPEAAAGPVMKLYQPTHGRFYLTAGGLVCARYGLPDKKVSTSCGESAFYVLRRLEPKGSGPVDTALPSTFRELGWVDEGAGRWVEVNGGLVAGEQRLPLFPMSYQDKRTRRMLAGFIPVANRERYETAVVRPAVPADTDDVAIQLTRPGADQAQPIAVSISALSELALLDALTPSSPDPETLQRFLESTFFALLDLATFLHQHASRVLVGSPLTAAEITLRDVLIGSGFPTLINWRSALNQIWDNRNVVVNELDDPPAPVTDLTVDNVASAVAQLEAEIADLPKPHGFAQPVGLTELLLDVYDPPATPPGNGDAGTGTTPDTEASAIDGAVYVSRLVYERPRCRPPYRLTISRPSAVFALAHFYDPDAPFRDNRIVLPVDTTIEGLRKFPRAVRVDMSTQLRKQLDRIEAIKLADLDDGNIPDGKAMDLGMICSLSIPIITICALILLMIIVSLLNIVFFWLPLFKICLPKVD